MSQLICKPVYVFLWLGSNCCMISHVNCDLTFYGWVTGLYVELFYDKSVNVPLIIGKLCFWKKVAWEKSYLPNFVTPWKYIDMGPYLGTKYSSCLVCDAVTLDRWNAWLWRWWEQFAKWHWITYQKTWICRSTAVRTSDLVLSGITGIPYLLECKTGFYP